MKYYYYPLCTKDFAFENIFASESLSPPDFYSKRGFGIDYFYHIPNINQEEVLILFDKPPRYDTGSDNSNIRKFILEIDEGCLDPDGIVKVNDQIIAYQKTIYLNKKNFNVLFFSDVDLKVITLKSQTSLPTKGVKKFEKNFKTLNEADCFEYNLPASPIKKLNNTQQEKALTFDRTYNAKKGLLYGIIAGSLFEKTSDQLIISRSFREIANSFAEFNNRRQFNLKKTASNSNKPGSLSSIISFYDKLINAIKNSEEMVGNFFPDQLVSEEDIAKYLLSKNSDRLKTLADALQYISHRILDEKYSGIEIYTKIKNEYLSTSGEHNASIYYGQLKSVTEALLKTVTSVKSNQEERSNNDLHDTFKKALFKLEELTENKFKSRSSMPGVELETIINDINGGIDFIDGFGSLTPPELNEYKIIVNVLITSAKIGRGEVTKQRILEIVEDIGNRTHKGKEGKRTRLYQYLNDEINEYSIDSAPSVVTRNFVAFVFNINSIENLENYNEAKGIEKKWIGNSFWCAFNGFANTSGTFLNGIFNSENEALQNYIDDYLKKKLFHGLVYQSDVEGVNLVEEESLSKPLSTEKIITLGRDKLQRFYEKHIKEKYNIPLEDFIMIFQIKSKNEIVNRLKDRFKVLKKDGNKLVDSFSEFIRSDTLF